MHVLDGEVSRAEYNDGWFKTDHHWNMKGAYDAYVKLISALNVKNPVEACYKTWNEPALYGSMARRALDDEYSDEVVDVITDRTSSLRVEIDGVASGGAELLSHAKEYDRGVWDTNRFTSRYGEYFHQNYGLISVTNDAEYEKEAILVVGDSYMNCIDRLIATHYRNTYIVNPSLYEGSVGELISSIGKVDEVVVLMMRSSLVSESTMDFFAG